MVFQIGNAVDFKVSESSKAISPGIESYNSLQNLNLTVYAVAPIRREDLL
jgi:hypothetical protein